MIGGNVFGWTADRAAAFRALDARLDAGLNAIDTTDVHFASAPGHGGGGSGSVIGDWLSGHDRGVIATRVGMGMGSGDKGLAPGWVVWPPSARSPPFR